MHKYVSNFMYVITANYLSRSHHANKNKFKENDKGGKKKKKKCDPQIIVNTFSNFAKPKLI